MNAESPRLFCFGLGYSATHLARRLLAQGWSVAGTCQGEEKRRDLAALGIEAHLFDRERPLVAAASALAGATHLLSSVPPDGAGDPVLDALGPVLAGAGWRWTGYLSTTGVYGDTGGAVVDEKALLAPTSERARRRAAAEAVWLALHRDRGVPVHVFRLAGIYGPGRSALDRIREGAAQRVIKPGHAFGRIHVDDIATVLMASMAKPDPGAIYNLCDDEPAAPAEVIAFACRLLGVAPPPPVAFDEAAKTMSPMALSFWRDNRRVDNGRIKRDLGVGLAYPSYREGLAAILAAEGV
ncbi:SDR family oxidoreductase [Shumkonia mesophila]|uniref:SDR family oxidoreductase n=1 Tax=Shumkonia mesophila TaxID=2838854 RepID=UPI0029352A03|nr:SDR family oxidoreductase [Shumkonia mesophila]